MIGEVNKDIRIVYDFCFPKVNAHGEEYVSNYNVFLECDYSNPEHVRCVLTMPKYESTHPCYFIREDIMAIINDNSSLFSKNELKVAHLFYVEGGMNTVEASDISGIAQPHISRALKGLSEKIARISSL